MTGLLETRKLIASQQLVLWHDYRAGHCLNLAGHYVDATHGPTEDGVVDATVGGNPATPFGRFRTGVGWETVYDLTAPESLGYIRVAHSDLFYPDPDTGFCIIASYMRSNADDYTNTQRIIGQYASAMASGSWALYRTNATIILMTSDGAVQTLKNFPRAAVPGQIETLAVRVDGTSGNSAATTYVLAPTAANSATTNVRTPQDSALDCTICAANDGLSPFFGTLRYVAFIRNIFDPNTGAALPSVDMLKAIAAEMEAFDWEDAVQAMHRHGGTDPRRVHYSSRFGPDVSVAETDAATHGSAYAGSQVSNSDWCKGPCYRQYARIGAVHQRGALWWALEDIDKVLYFNESAPQ
jgi:hypothetical protein